MYEDNESKFDPKEILKTLSDKDFASFGVQDVAYLRPLEMDGKTMYAVHAADGSHISVSEDEREAAMMLRQSGLEAVRLQ